MHDMISDMEQNKIDQIIDSFVQNFSIEKVKRSRKERGRAVTFWVPDEIKKKYDIIQAKTESGYHRSLHELIVKIIDKTPIDEKAS